MNLIVHWLAGFKFFCFMSVVSFPLIGHAADGQFVHWLPSPVTQSSDKHVKPDSLLSGHDKPTADYKEILAWLKSAPAHGIDWPQDIRSKLTGHVPEPVIQELANELASYLDTGVVNKRTYQPRWYIKDNPSIPAQNHPLDIEKLKRSESRIPQYHLLKKSLNRLQYWVKSAPELFPDQLTIELGQHDRIVTRLSQWLQDAGITRNLLGDMYTKKHQAVLSSIQKYWGGEVNGIFDGRTRHLLEEITRQRISLIKVNMERMRWLPSVLPFPHILVDIAGYQVDWVIDNKKRQRYKAIVGSSKRQTPVFQERIESVTINPPWRVPHSIASTSLLKAEQRFPGFLKEEGFIIYDGWSAGAKSILPNDVNWEGLSSKNFPFRLMQKPGKANRLGQFKLDLPNSFSIYLHDTDKPWLFNRSKRAFSAGCTRVEGIEQLVQSILHSQNIKTSSDPLFGGGITRKVMLKKAIPIYFVYFTAWPDGNGRIIFRDDIYQLDQPLLGWVRSNTWRSY